MLTGNLAFPGIDRSARRALLLAEIAAYRSWSSDPVPSQSTQPATKAPRQVGRMVPTPFSAPFWALMRSMVSSEAGVQEHRARSIERSRLNGKEVPLARHTPQCVAPPVLELKTRTHRKILTVLETSTSFRVARAATRAPMWTANPPTSSPINSHSPVWSPARISTPNWRRPCRIAQAQRIPRLGPENVTKKTITCRFHLSPTETGYLTTDSSGVRDKDVTPPLVSQFHDSLCRPNNVGK